MKRILMIAMLVIAMIGLAQLSLFANQAFAGDGDADGQSSACQCDGVIGDYVWHDLDHGQSHLVDGIQDAGEPGIEGVLVELYDGNGDFYADTTTDANGFYQFTDLPYDDYTVKIADSNFDPGGVLEGWYASPPDEGGDESLDSDGDRDTHEAAVSLNNGNIHNDVDFGFFMTGVDLQKTGPDSVVLGDDITYHFRVENTGDVVLHGGVQVYDALIEPDGDHEIWSGVVYPGEVYEFDRTYTPDENDCGSLTNTANAVGHPQYPDGSYLDDVTDEDSWTTQVDCNASLGDYVWHDLDHGQSHLVDGIQDAGEPGLEGVVMELYDDGGALVGTTTTDANGYYQFDNLSPGDYTIKVADSNFQANGALDETDSAVDWHASPQDAGSDNVDSDQDESTYEAAVTLSPGVNNLDIDFGFFKSCVKLTKTGPDFVNPGETFNFHFRVENCGDVVLHGGVSVYDALINPDGDHEIWNDVVYPGEVKEFDEAYTADESECPSIVNDATAVGHPQHPDGSYLANVTDEDSWTVTCASFSLGDWVWRDEDADGVQDADESGVNGVTVDLYSGTCDSLTASSTPVQTTTTAANNGVDGWYEFTGLGAGDYCVALSRDNYAPGGPLVGLVASPANASGDPATDSNASASLKADVSLSADDATIDFGLYPAPPIEAGQCYVVSDSGDYLGRIDHATGRVQVLGKVDPPDGENLAIRPSDFTIFNVAGENTTTPLITIDDQTAAATTINADLGLDDVDALAFDTATQTMYAVKVDPNPGVLYTIDPATGAATHVVDLQTPSPDPLAGKTDPHIDGIAIHPSTGVMYGAYSAWASKSYLVTIDKTTGQLTLVGGPAGDEGYTGVDDIEDLSFNQDGTLYGVLGDQGAFGGDASGSFEGLVILDAQTANATAVGRYGDPLQGMGEWDMEALSCAIPPTSVSIGDFVWWDLNEDGIQDAGEPGIQDVTVTLKDAGGNTVGATTTDANGAYSFTDLAPGDYTVVFTLPGSDWSFSPQGQGGDDAKDSDADPNTGEVSVSLMPGEHDFTIDAGMTIPSSYAITKENTTVETDVAPGDPISFTITIQNTGETWLTQIPLRDEYDTDYLAFVEANPTSDDNDDDGVVDWSDLTVSFGQHLAPGESFTVVVHFTAKETTENLPNHETINTATAHDVLADPDGTNGPTAAASLPDQSDDAPANILNPVGEAMGGFWARGAGHAVRLHWQTASEKDILGFNVLRSSDDGPFVQINESLIFARHAGADEGTSYRYEDRSVPGGRVIYILEIIYLNGRVERYGREAIATYEISG